MNLKSHQLHSHPDREKLFAENQTKIWHEDFLVSNWVVTDPDMVIDILRRPGSAMPDWQSFIELAEEATGCELQNLRTASRYTPLLLSQDEHAALRKALAVYLAGQLKKLEPQLPGIVAEALAPLTRPGEFDLYRDVARPIVDRVAEGLIDCPLPPGFSDMSLFEIFPAIRSPTLTRRVDKEFGNVFAHLSQYTSNDMDMACKICCLVFGVDTLAMLMVENVLRALREAPAGAAAKLPDYPVETAVPMTNRTPSTEWVYDGHRFGPGDVVRLQLQPLGYSSDPRHNVAIFGVGMHACVGKQVSLKVWHHFKERFNNIGPSGQLRDYKLFPSASICLYDKVTVEIFP
jgi:hypothetical protein